MTNTKNFKSGDRLLQLHNPARGLIYRCKFLGLNTDDCFFAEVEFVGGAMDGKTNYVPMNELVKE